jgi:hypothetical protein
VFDAFTIEAIPWERTAATRDIVVVQSAEEEAGLRAAILELNHVRESIGLPEVRIYDLR